MSIEVVQGSDDGASTPHVTVHLPMQHQTSTSVALANYEYTELPFPSSTIRIFHISPGPNEGVVSGTLDASPLESETCEYTALSY